MADVKKDAKGGAKGAPESKVAGEIEAAFAILVFLAIFFVALPNVLRFFGHDITWDSIKTWWAGFSFSAERAFSAFFSGLIFVSVFLCMMFIVGVLYAKFKISQITHEQEASKEKPGEAGGAEQLAVADMSTLDPLTLPGDQAGTKGSELQFAPPPQNERWVEIQKHMQSGNQAEWRLAILEADIMLYDMLEQMGYEGDSIGDKLKQVEPASFNTLDEAWRAHKVRNIIAHEGNAYVLPRSEADRAIRQYETVFKEFYFI
jgi:hypothetical protein